VFEKTVLRRIFGKKQGEATGERRKLHNEEISHFYSSPNRIIKLRRMKWASHVARMGEKEKACRLLGGKEITRGPRRRWVDNIRMNLLELGWGGVDWIVLAQDRNR
jgi:hypothetical protein